MPNGARIVSTTAQDAGVDQYDRSIYFQLDTTSPRTLVKFYRTELQRARWSLLGAYPLARGGTEVLAQRAGSRRLRMGGRSRRHDRQSLDLSRRSQETGRPRLSSGSDCRLFVVPDSGS